MSNDTNVSVTSAETSFSKGEEREERRFGRNASLVNTFLAAASICITLGSGFAYLVTQQAASTDAVRTQLSEYQKSNESRFARIETRLSTQEDKTRQYDALITLRTNQYTEIITRLTRIETQNEMRRSR